jgi:hypothetical protein
VIGSEQFVWGVLAPNAFTRSLNFLLGQDAERRQLIRNIKKRVPFAPSAGFERWLNKSSTCDAVALAAPQGHADLLRDLVDELTQDWRAFGWEITPALNERARHLLDATYDGVIETSEAPRAVAIGTARIGAQIDGFSGSVHGKLDKIDQDIAALGRADPESLLALLPHTAATPLGRVLAEHPTVGRRLLGALATGRAGLAAVATYLTDPPSWLEDAPAEAWVALAEFAEGHRDFQLAASLFEQAADVMPDRGRWMMRAAGCQLRATGPHDARPLMERAAALGADPALLVALRAAVDDTCEELAELEFEQVASEAWACLALVSAVEKVQGAAVAVALAEQAVQRHPHAAGLRLMLAGMLVQVFRTTPTRGPRNAPTLALSYARTARDQRRAWGGNSADAVVVACEAAVASGEYEEAIRLGIVPPDGEASPAEAASIEVSYQVARAASACGAVEVLAATIDRLPPGSPRHLFTGHLLKRQQAAHETVIACYQGNLPEVALRMILRLVEGLPELHRVRALRVLLAPDASPSLAGAEVLVLPGGRAEPASAGQPRS